MKFRFFPLIAAGTFATALFALTGPASGAETVKTFILVGQSNMQGKGSVFTMNHMIKDPRTKATFAALHDGKGHYKTRDDVYINFLEKRGKLTVGYGSGEDWIGPELGFGWTVGDAIAEPVLIIKAAYGGRSLYRDFRPSSAGLPADGVLQQELEQAQKRTRQRNEQRNQDNPIPTMEDIKSRYGFAYRDMMGEVANVRDNYQTLFPELKGKKLDVAGVVWFQGWNDMINPEFTAAYTETMKHVINDVRRDIGDPDLPFIIGQLGVGGPYVGDDPGKDKKEVFKANQAAAAEGMKNVAVVKTDQFWDPVAAEKYENWRDDIDEWRKYGNDHGYHYLGSPLIVYRIGKAFGEKMLELTGEAAN